MLTQTSYIISRFIKKNKNILYFRTNSSELDYSIWQECRKWKFYCLSIDRESWDFDKYPTSDNVIFITDLNKINDVDINLIINPHRKEIFDLIKSLYFLPKVSLFLEKPNLPIIQSVEFPFYGNICLAPNQEIFKSWSLSGQDKIIKDFNPKIFKNTIEKFNESFIM